MTILLVCGALLGIDLANPQIETPEQVAAMRALLPELADPKANKRLHDDRLIFWTSSSIGVAYQAHSGDRPGSGPIGFADAGAPGRPNQNTLDRFPWAPVAGGTHRAKRADSFKALYLPRDSRRRPYPIVWYRYDLEGLVDPHQVVLGWDWIFPVGSIVWEILTAEDAGEAYVYEVRSRWRYRDHWRPRVYRPFPTAASAAAAILDRPRTNLGAAFVEYCYQPVQSSATITSREDGNPAFATSAGAAFSAEFGVDELPPLPRELVAELLDLTQFQDVQGAAWKPGCASPISKHNFHFVPQGALLAIVGGDEVSCAPCHSTSLTSSRRFATNPRRWGWVRGNHGDHDGAGGILSWHPVDPAVFRGRARANPNVRMRTRWIACGIVRKFNRGKHHKGRYTRLQETR